MPATVETTSPPFSLPTPTRHRRAQPKTNIAIPTQLTSPARLRQTHAHAIRAGIDNPPFWNAVARAYATGSTPRLALAVLVQMPHRDRHSFPLAFKLCAHLSAYAEAFALHAHLLKLGLASDARSLNALIGVYSASGQLELAAQVFGGIPHRTVASWTAMAAALDRNGKHQASMGVFLGMLETGERADEAATVTALAACTHSGWLDFGKAIHAYGIVSGLWLGELVGFATALVDMYAKNGELGSARKVFGRMAHRNERSWGAMIGGLAAHGLGPAALELFEQMVGSGVEPTPVTVTNVLSACSHVGLVGEGLRLFERIKNEFSFEPVIEHYGCVVDLLGRAGLLAQARKFVGSMPMAPTAAIWRSLLGAASTHGDLETGSLAGEKLVEAGEIAAGDYVMLANLYARFGTWEEVGRVRTEMNDLGVRKVAGLSSVEVNGVVHQFVMGDWSHPQSERIHEMLELLNWGITERSTLFACQ